MMCRVMCVCLAFLAVAQGSAATADLLVGVAETEITPPLGFPMAGYYHERLAKGTRDPLKAKAMVLRDGDQAAAFVIADVTGIARDLCQEVRRKASASTGIPEDHIVVSATHSHTAPDYSGYLYRHIAGTAGTSDNDRYPARLIDAIVTAVSQADTAAEPVLLESGIGQQQTPVAFNRRFVMRDGSVQTWQNFRNENVVRPAGPIDPEVGLLLIRSADGTPSAVFSNFALHLDTVGGHEWSADYPYFIERGLRDKLGASVVSLFGLGACGDINHSDPTRTDRNKTDFIGNSLFETIDSAIPTLKRLKETRLQVRTATVPVRMQEVSQQELNRAVELIPVARAGGKVAFFDLVSAYKSVVLDQLQHAVPRVESTKYLSWGLSHSWAGVGDSLPVDVVTMTVGDEVAIVFLPGEVFVELGLSIKQASPYRTTMIVELSNCVETMYIPTRAAYAGGSYEVTNSALEPGSGEALVEAALRLLRESAADYAR